MKVVVASDAPTDADSFAHVVLRYNPGSAHQAAAALASACGVDAAKGVGFSQACKAAGLSETDVKAAAEVLKGTNVATITTHSLLASTDGRTAHTVLSGAAAALAQAHNHLGNACNTAGAHELGLVPAEASNGTRAILESCVSGKTKTLLLIGADPIDQFEDATLAANALESVETLVYIAALPGSSAAYASAILPLALPAEQDGTYTSSEFRVQKMRQVLPTPGQAKPGWKLLAEIADRLKPGTAPFSAAEVMERISATVPAFSQVSFNDLPEAGYLLPQKETAFDPSALSKAWPDLK